MVGLLVWRGRRVSASPDPLPLMLLLLGLTYLSLPYGISKPWGFGSLLTARKP